MNTVINRKCKSCGYFSNGWCHWLGKPRDRGWYLSAGPVGSTKLPFAEISMAYYVHELQHVIRDAKVNKEIVL